MGILSEPESAETEPLGVAAVIFGGGAPETVGGGAGAPMGMLSWAQRPATEPRGVIATLGAGGAAIGMLISFALCDTEPLGEINFCGGGILGPPVMVEAGAAVCALALSLANSFTESYKDWG